MNYTELCKFLEDKPKISFRTVVVADEEKLEGNAVNVQNFRVIGYPRKAVEDLLAAQISEYILGKQHVMVRTLPEIERVYDPAADPYLAQVVGRARIVAY